MFSRRLAALGWLQLVFVLILMPARQALAAEGHGNSPEAQLNYEAWAGGNATQGSTSIYAGLTAALFGDVRRDGWRVRSSASYGRYTYVRSYYDASAGHNLDARFKGHATHVDALIGYQKTVGPATIKLFAGVVEETHLLGPQNHAQALLTDPENAVQGRRVGFKGALETWMNLGDQAFLQADLGWSQPFSSYSARLRLGYKLNSLLSIGLEGTAAGSKNYDRGGAGAFLRVQWSRGEVSLSGGLNGDDAGVGGAYGTVSALFRF